MVVILLFSSCRNRQEGKGSSNRDPFYTSKGSYDAVRIPLIKPYVLLKLNGDSSWRMNLVETPGSISDVRGVLVRDNFIFLQAGESYCNDEKAKESWAIIQVLDKSEKCFLNQELFEAQSKGHITFKNPDLVYKEFNEKGTYSW